MVPQTVFSGIYESCGRKVEVLHGEKVGAGKCQ